MQRNPLAIRTRWNKPKTFCDRVANSLRSRWTHFWAKQSGISSYGRLAAWLANLTAPPHIAGTGLANIARSGFFIAPGAIVYHSNLSIGKNVYSADRVILYQNMYRGIKGG